MGLGNEKNLFAKRLRKLERKDRAIERGFVTQLRADGLLIVKPKRRAFGISGKSVIVFLAAFVVFKGLAVAELGQATYEARLAQLNSGTVVEQAAGWVMQTEPATMFVAEKLRIFLK